MELYFRFNGQVELNVRVKSESIPGDFTIGYSSKENLAPESIAKGSSSSFTWVACFDKCRFTFAFSYY